MRPGNNEAASRLVSQYLPFIKSETAKYIKRVPQEGRDDELSIAMFAFHEAVLSYEKTRGSFLAYAARAIRNRLIDYSRKEQRHSNLISLDKADDDGGEDGRSLMEKLDTGRDDIHEHAERSAAREEIGKFARGAFRLWPESGRYCGQLSEAGTYINGLSPGAGVCQRESGTAEYIDGNRKTADFRIGIRFRCGKENAGAPQKIYGGYFTCIYKWF